ncbi:MAG: HAAS signaling domain-containing protein [Chitinophagales bacterium]
MKKRDFLVELEQSLSGFPAGEKREILSDYEEHFRMGLAEGKTEEEIAASLGPPKTIAKGFRAEYLVEQAKTDKSAGNIMRAILAVISLSFFNLVVVLGPFMALVGVLIGLWAAVAAIVVSGVAVALAAPLASLLPWAVMPQGGVGFVGLLLVGFGLACLGAAGCIGLFHLTVLFYRGMVGYLKFNLRIIKG